MADAEPRDGFLELLADGVRASGHHEALVDELLPGDVLEDLLGVLGELRERAVLDRVDGPVAGRVGEGREHVETPVEEVETVLRVKLLGLTVGLGNADDLGEGGPVRRQVLAPLGHAAPVAVHQRLGALVAEEGQVRIVVVVVEAEVPGLDGAAARDVNRRVRLLDGLGPAVDPAELVVLPVEGEGLVGRPRAHDQLVGLAVLVAGQGRDLAVAEIGVHRRADGEARHEASAGDDVEHGELLGHADGRVVERDGVADHADGRPRGPASETRCNNVGRGHEPVAVLVMLVHPDPVEPERVRVLELVHVLVIDEVALARVVERAGDVDPDGTVLLPEVVGQVGPRHEIEPRELHRSPRLLGTARLNGPISRRSCQSESGRSNRAYCARQAILKRP